MGPEMLDELKTAVPRPMTPALPEHLDDRLQHAVAAAARSSRRRPPSSSKDSIQDAIDGKGILP